MAPGTYFYFGITSAGKTTLARAHTDQDNDEGRNFVILDCMPAKNFRHLAHEPNVDAVLLALFGDQEHAPRNCIYTPRSDEEVEQLMNGIHDGGAAGHPVTVLWDECWQYMSKDYIGPGTNRALKGWQHSDNTYRLVTQQPGNLHGNCFATYPEVYCFRLERGKDLDRVAADFKFDPKVIETLPQGKFETYSRDRWRAQPPPPAPPA